MNTKIDNKVIIRSLPNRSKVMVNKEKPSDNLVPETSHKLKGPFLDPKTGMLSVRLDLIDFEMLGFKTTKPDSRAITETRAFIEKTRLEETKSKKEEINKITMDIKQKKDELSKVETLINQLRDQLIEYNTEKFNLEKEGKPLKKVDENISITTKELGKNENKLDTLRTYLSDKKLELEIAEVHLGKDSEIIKSAEENLRRLERENQKTRRELEMELAQSLGGDTLSLDPSNKFWFEKVPLISIDNNDLTFSWNDPIQMLQFAILMGTGWIADSNSHEDIAKCKNARYYIYNERMEEERKLELVNLRERAISYKQSMDLETMKAILELYSIPAYSMSPLKIQNAINELMERDYKSFIEAAKMDNTELKKKAFIRSLLETKILRQRADGRIMYGDIDKGRDLGYTIDEVADYVYSPINIQLRQRLQKLMDTKILGIVTTGEDFE